MEETYSESLKGGDKENLEKYRKEIPLLPFIYENLLWKNIKIGGNLDC